MLPNTAESYTDTGNSHINSSISLSLSLSLSLSVCVCDSIAMAHVSAASSKIMLKNW